MDNARFFARLSVLLICAVLFVGCGPDRSDSQSEDPSSVKSKAAKVDHLKVAKQKLLVQDFDEGAESAYLALVEDPGNVDATLVASQIELGRGNFEIAVDLARSIELDSRYGAQTVDVLATALAKQGEYSQAADVLNDAFAKLPGKARWRHQAWEWLNRVGRREEASTHALALANEGQATQTELLSLIRRSWSFPFDASSQDDPTERLASGLGLGRWHFTQSDYDAALEELSQQYENGFESPAASALYGRLLAETQSLEEFPNWHAKCGDAERKLSDYWAALGTYLYDVHELESSARALLEAVYRNPTDRISFQRLSKVYRGLDRQEDGEQFRHRGVKIAETETYCKALTKEPTDKGLKLALVKNLADLGRPIETLLWSRSMLTAANQAERMQLDQQLYQLSRDSRIDTMASEVAMLGVDRDQYSLNAGLKRLRTMEVAAVESSPRQTDVLATPRLVDVASEVGIDFQWYKDLEIELESIPIHESLGGGIGIADFDLDGWPDVYLGQGSGDPPTDKCTRSNVLLRNLDGRFSAVTEAARMEDFNYTSGVAVGDVNQDGFPDVWAGALGHNRLFLNNGDGTFQETTDVITGDDRFSSSLAIADINGDALPDLFEANYIAMEGGFDLPKMGENGKPVLPGPLAHLPGFDRWYSNGGDGSFAEHEITMEVAKPGTSLGVIVTDFDEDGSNEVFVGNDVRPNHFLFQRGNDEFYNLADVKGVANGYEGVPNGCMGITAADYNRDGLVDLHITNFHTESGNLFIQNGSGLFTDYAIRYGISEPTMPMVGFGTKSIDFDRNGWLDLIITNGNIFDTRIYRSDNLFKMPPQLLMGSGNRFDLVEVDGDPDFWNHSYLGRAMSSFDFDRNGSVDVIVGHVDRPVAVLRNETKTAGAWVQLRLVGRNCERDAIGARVIVKAGDEAFTQWVTAGDGYLCSDEPFLDFGLGTFEGPVSVAVHWPGGAVQDFADLSCGKRFLLVEEDENAFELPLISANRD